MINAQAKASRVVFRKQRVKSVAAANEFAVWLEGNEKLFEQLTIPIISCGRTWHGRSRSMPSFKILWPMASARPVSYTHLTLPTIYSV